MVQPDSIPLRHMMLLCSWMFLLSCTGQGGNTIPQAPVQPSTDKLLEGTLRGPAQEQISEYIRRMFQDREGNIWFGTNGDGVCRYDGRSLVYYLAGTTVRGDRTGCERRPVVRDIKRCCALRWHQFHPVHQGGWIGRRRHVECGAGPEWNYLVRHGGWCIPFRWSAVYVFRASST
ncbi:MAG: hypothetical protein KF843_02525 [Flavobacteriales bacterium]|nr:hypothetical protein [Flavobacteriales bacterium]